MLSRSDKCAVKEATENAKCTDTDGFLKCTVGTIGTKNLESSDPQDKKKSYELYPQTANTLYFYSENIVTPETNVFIGHIEVTKKDITILGRKSLKIHLPANNGLIARLKPRKDDDTTTKDDNKIEVIAVTPGIKGYCILGEVTLKSSTAKPPMGPTKKTMNEGEISIDIEHGKDGTKIITKNKI